MRVRGLRWWIAGLLMLATVVNYLDRQCLAVAAPHFMKDLSIDKQTYSYILTGFMLSYMVMQPVAGRVMDWLGTRLGFILAVVLWSVSNMLHGFAGGWRSLAFFRVLLGAGEAGNFPGAIKTVGEWFPPKQRTIATGIFNTGASIGAMLAPPVVVWIIWKWNWQAAFVATGAVGFLWVILWTIFYRPPEKHPWLTPRERAVIQAEHTELPVAEPPKEHGVWRVVLPQRNFWAISLARFLSEPAWQFFSYWIPLYMMEARGLDLKGIAMFAWVPFLAAALGCLFGGMLSPFFQKLGLSVLTSRKASATVAGLIMVPAIFIGMAPSPEWAILFFSVGAFAHQTMSSTLLTLPADLFPKRTVGTAYGRAGTAGYAGGILFTLIVGYVAQNIGYAPLFVAIAFLDLIGAGLLWLMVRVPRAVEPAPAEAAA
jgi:ACS family hexuronate transporter-like MFS transporter